MRNRAASKLSGLTQWKKHNRAASKLSGLTQWKMRNRAVSKLSEIGFGEVFRQNVEYMLVAMDHNNHKVRLVLSGGDVLHSLQEKGENTNPNTPVVSIELTIMCKCSVNQVEYMLVAMDHNSHKVRLVLSAGDVLHALQEKGENTNPNHPTLWRPEYGSYMIEGTPGQPYGGTMSEFNTVEDNMGKRRREASSLLKENQTLCTITAFPRLGCPGFTFPEYDPKPVEEGVSTSLFIPDEAINEHPRFRALNTHVNHRRGEKVVINVPMRPLLKIRNQTTRFCFGGAGEGGGSANDTNTARMALSAASPFYRGYVSDNDCRWGVISASVDDRTREERGLEPLKHNKYRISKSRYDSIDSYLSSCGEKYNDIELTIDEEINKQLLEAGCNAAVHTCASAQNGLDNDNEEYALMSIDTLINGKEGVFHGLIPILNCYLENMEADVETRCTILNYFKLIKKRASGELMTMAQWMREFVANHPEYKQDSVITDKINYDLIVKCDQIANGAAQCPELLGDPVNRAK
ncbi:UNVERIFIED_CONTAM: hypothetical protein FKN15_010903 [Acipenser sinensis]